MSTINRYFQIIIILTFVFSSTGIPLVIHICKMTGRTTFQSCEMHNNKHGENNVKTKFANNCCRGQLIGQHLNSEYISVKDSKMETGKLEIVIPVFTTNIPTQTSIQNNLLFSNSPPLNYSNSIIITNRVLLI